MYIVLVYDIKLNEGGSRVLRNVFKSCKKYLVHLQNSVFEGEVSRDQLLALKLELKQYLREDEDSCIIFRARNNIWMNKEYLTNEVDKNTQFL
ncbi:CRISPR-associated endonuclease Cas2 [Eubacteriaceae bacterium ES3]|nr:CRISPR-associated endonuclease Cas2 [Eubacteriaceae bacterium ES3]